MPEGLRAAQPLGLPGAALATARIHLVERPVCPTATTPCTQDGAETPHGFRPPGYYPFELDHRPRDRGSCDAVSGCHTDRVPVSPDRPYPPVGLDLNGWQEHCCWWNNCEG